VHHRLDVDAVVGSRAHGYVKPHPTIFQAALQQLGAEPAEAAMVGDSIEEDIEGARALGMRAILIDRDDRHADVEERLTDLYGLPAALGLSRSGAT
jgi:FMN phosphatase YigB (HAD superfamily)